MSRLWGILGMCILLGGCTAYMPGRGSATAAVVLPSTENSSEFDVHLLVLPPRGSKEELVLVSLEYRSFSYLLGIQQPPGEMRARDLRRMTALLLGITPDTVYISSEPERSAASRLLSRLSGTGETVEFGFGKDASRFFSLLLEHASSLADEQVLVYLGGIYDDAQVSQKKFAEGLNYLGSLGPNLRNIPVSADSMGRLPYGGELLRTKIAQIISSLEGDR